MGWVLNKAHLTMHNECKVQSYNLTWSRADTKVPFSGLSFPFSSFLLAVIGKDTNGSRSNVVCVPLLPV